MRGLEGADLARAAGADPDHFLQDGDIGIDRAQDGGDTVLAYDVDAQVGGKIAQVGARLIQGTAKKLADQFFGKFAESVGAPPPAASPEAS